MLTCSAPVTRRTSPSKPACSHPRSPPGCWLRRALIGSVPVQQEHVEAGGQEPLDEALAGPQVEDVAAVDQAEVVQCIASPWVQPLGGTSGHARREHSWMISSGGETRTASLRERHNSDRPLPPDGVLGRLTQVRAGYSGPQPDPVARPQGLALDLAADPVKRAHRARRQGRSPAPSTPGSVPRAAASAAAPHGPAARSGCAAGARRFQPGDSPCARPGP